MSDKRLTRTRKDDGRMFLGVASGIADYFGIDPVIVRLVFVLLALLKGWGLLLYLILAIIMPEETEPVAKVNSFDEDEIIIKDA